MRNAFGPISLALSLIAGAAPAPAQEEPPPLAPRVGALKGRTAPDAADSYFLTFDSISSSAAPGGGPEGGQAIWLSILVPAVAGDPEGGIFRAARQDEQVFLTSIAVQGQIEPNTGCEYSTFLSPPALHSERVVFTARLANGPCGSDDKDAVLSVRLTSATTKDPPILLALEGQMAPGGGTFEGFFGTSFGPHRVNSSGDVVFSGRARFTPTIALSGLYVAPGNGDPTRRVVFDAAGAPRPPGFIYYGFLDSAIYDDGRVGFYANVVDGNLQNGTEGLYMEQTPGGGPASVKAVALRGDIVETDQGNWTAEYFELGNLIGEGNDAQMEFRVIQLFPNEEAVARGDPVAVVASGDPAPGTGGGSYSGFNYCHNDANGIATYTAGVAGGSVGQGIFSASPDGSVQEALVLEGDPAPGTGGGTFDFFVSCPDRLHDGTTVFTADTAGGTSSGGIFLVLNGEVRKVVARGDPVPGTPHTFENFPYGEFLTPTDVFFHASFDGNQEGIFLAPFERAQVPALGPRSLAFLVGVLILGGALAAWEHRGRRV